jgi:hypothetical protein
MEFMRRRSVEVEGYKFEVREVSIAIRREIEAVTKAGGDQVEETLKRCVFYDGKPLGDDAANLGYSFATPLVLAIQQLANEGVPEGALAKAAAGETLPVIGTAEAPAGPNGQDGPARPKG